MIGMRSLYEIRYGGRLITSTFANSADEAREKALREARMLGHYRDAAPYIMRGEVSRVTMNKTGGKRTAKRRNRAGIPEDWIVRGAIGDEGFEIETESHAEAGRLFEDLSRKIERAGGGFIRVQHRRGRPGMWHEVLETSYGRGRWHTQHREPDYQPHGPFNIQHPHGYERYNQVGGKRTAKRSSNRAGMPKRSARTGRFLKAR